MATSNFNKMIIYKKNEAPHCNCVKKTCLIEQF